MTAASSPLVVVLCGLPGSGKTRLALSLAERLDLERLSRDELCWEEPRCGLVPGEAKRAAFDELLRQLVHLLESERDVVVEGMPFSRRREHSAVSAIAERCEAATCTLWLDCPLELARQRILVDRAAGAHPASDRVPALVDEVASRWEAPENALRLDASLPSPVLLAQALDVLRSRFLRT